MQPGPRQTVDRAKHPTLGEGVAVYDNGPAYFQPDGGEPVPMKEIGFGGCSSTPPRSYIVAYTTSGQRIELETTGRAHGDRHYRRWHPIHGPAWLVVVAGTSSRRGIQERWEGDDGKTFTMRVVEMRVGKPGNWKKNGDMRDDISEEDENWLTYGLDSGETFVFRCASPEDLPIGSDQPIGKIGALKQQKKQRKGATIDLSRAAAMQSVTVAKPSDSPARPVVPLAGKWPAPGASRAEVDAFVSRRAS